MKCGETIFIIDIDGSYRVRFVAQCGDRFLVVAHTWDRLNGLMLSGWKAVLRELVGLAVPLTMTDKLQTAQSTAGGTYVSVPLGYPLQASQLAALLGNVDTGEVLDALHDLAVPGMVVSHAAS